MKQCAKCQRMFDPGKNTSVRLCPQCFLKQADKASPLGSRLSPVSSIFDSLKLAPDTPCAVCQPAMQSFSFSGLDPRNMVVLSIMGMLKQTGSFSVQGIESFWRPFKDKLCASCQVKLDSISAKKREAVRILEEAVKLDPKNKSVKQNLDAIKQQL